MSSEYLRKQGNKLYLQAIEDGVSPFSAKDRLMQALKYYYQARTKSNSQQELSSCLKNIGKAHYQMVKVKSDALELAIDQELLSENETVKLEEEIRYHAGESLNELFAALESGWRNQNEAWYGKLQSDISHVINDILQLFSQFRNFDRRVAAMFVLAGWVIWKEWKALIYIKIAGANHQQSVLALEGRDFRSSLRAVHEMNYPLEEVARLSENDIHKAEVRTLKADAFYQLASAESMQTISVAYQQLTKLLNDEEFLNLNIVFDTLDMFKEAALKAREVDVEQEAIACYYQGYIFEKILKLKQKGKTFYLQAMQLTEAAKPKLFNGEKWYDTCTASLKSLQDEARKRDDKEQEKIRQKLKKEMEKAINAIAAAKTAGAVQLLKHVYSKHPPKKTPFKLDLKELDGWDNLETKKKKRLLLKALNEYHPDKNSKDDYGEKWHFLVGEISKSISYFHDCEKNILKTN